MSLVRRARFITTNISGRPSDDGYGWVTSCSWRHMNTIQDVPGAVCWRCKREHKRGDHLVHIQMNSEDAVKPEDIYHYRCIPSARWNQGKLAGSLPAWELPCDESPAEKSGTSSAATPTNGAL